jgi:hypothetical protein
VTACQEGKESFDGQRVRKIIDGFGEILTQHLTEEIDTLLSLEPHSEKIDWHEYHKKVQKKAVEEGDAVSLLSKIWGGGEELMVWQELEVPCIITNMELHTEGGIHDSLWPPMPWFVLFMFRWWHIPKHKGAWRFSSCDSYGNPRDLPFV